jgi:hypothetical protein
VTNDSIQDRLVLRVGTQANEEFRIYITAASCAKSGRI